MKSSSQLLFLLIFGLAECRVVTRYIPGHGCGVSRAVLRLDTVAKDADAALAAAAGLECAFVSYFDGSEYVPKSGVTSTYTYTV